MITVEGRNNIRRYLAGYVPYIAGSAAFGISSTSEVVNDRYLGFEIARSNINLVSYNFNNNKLVFKASIPDGMAGKVYEVGLYSSKAESAGQAYGSRLLTTFDPIYDNWLDSSGSVPLYASTNARCGTDDVFHSPLASASTTSILRNLTYDFSNNTAADKFSFAVAVGNTNTASIRFRFLTDGNNFYDFNFGTGTVDSIGYKILTGTKASATATGAPNWARITEVQITTVSKASGQSAVEFDAIRIDNPNDYGLDNILVARKVLATPATKILGQPQDLEFALDINIP